MEWIEKIVWHEVVTRPPTEEEIREWAEWSNSDDELLTRMFDCEMPNDGCDILILMKNGWVFEDTCKVNDDYFGYNFLYLDSHDDWDDIVAWAYMPTGKKDEEAANVS